jgi:hypothetical protein
MIFAASAALAETAAAQKANRNWMNFTGYQTVAVERSPVSPRFSCAGSIYATANFAAPVDLSDGFYVTVATGGEVILQEKMTVEGNPGARRSIPVDIVPDDDANLGFPDATLDYSRALLTELKAGVHTITVAVSLGEDDDEQISAGTFSFDNRRGCTERFERVARLINGSETIEEPGAETEVEQTEEDTDTPVTPRPQPQKQQPAKQQGNGTNHIDFVNNCSDERYVTYAQPDGTFSVMPIQPGFSKSNSFPVGTKFWHGNGQHGSPFFTLGASRYVNDMDKASAAEKIQLCQ